jgi:flagellar protein FlgJ
MTSFASGVMPGVFDSVTPTLRDARVAVNQGGSLDTQDAGEVVQQFEAMLVRQMLKSMRAATSTLGDGLFSSANSTAYLEMFDGEIAARLTEGRGLGIGDMLRSQLGLGAAQPVSVRRFLPPANRQAIDAARPAGVARTASAAPATFADAADFVRSLLPLARRTAGRLGVSVRGLLAQMALETGWGRHVPPARDGRSSHNLFGIKAGGQWSGETTSLTTLELEDGVLQPRQAHFRVYDSPAGSLGDYAALLLGSPRYAEVLEHGASVRGFAGALQASGYATDPVYARKIESIADGELARLLDELESGQ